MAITSPLLGQYEANLNTSAGTDRVATDKDTFLKLLVAQLTHQDPLNPVEDKEFIAQLAQFTTVEELQNMNKGMASLNNAYLRQQSVSAAGLIGQYIEAPGDMVTIAGIGTDKAYSSYINFNLPRDASSLVMNVYAMDASGNPTRLVASNNFGAVSAREDSVQWNGRDNNNSPLGDGIYVVNFVATDVDGQGIFVQTSSTGRVVRVETAEDGNHNLVLQDLRSVKFNDVKIIDDPSIHESAPNDNANTGDNSAENENSGSGESEDGSAET